MRPIYRTLLLLACSLFILSRPAHAAPTNNLALTCTVVNGTCANGWTWNAPKAGVSVITQGGSWRVWNPSNSVDTITLCSSAIEPGTARSACKVVFFALSCNASGQKCGDPSVPPDTTATVVWTNPTIPTNGLSLKSNTLYRGTKSDGSDLVAYKVLPVSAQYVDTGLTPGSWCYALTATNDGGESVKSNVACKIIVAPEKIAPGPVSNTSVK